MASRRSTAVGLLGALLLLALAVVALQAQEPVRLAGWVQWAAATRMQVMTESAVSVAVVVYGVVSSDRRRIVVREIWRDSRRESWPQSP